MRIQGVVLDFGNTLTPWGEEQTRRYLGAIEGAFTDALGPQENFADRAFASRRALYERTERELIQTSFHDWVDEMMRGAAPSGLGDAVTQAVREVFPQICAVPDTILATLRSLAERGPVGILSNFPIGDPVRAVLDRDGVTELTTTILVSGEHGFRKPHPELFEIVRERLGTPMENTLMVGDEFWADIYGAFNAGYQTALTREFVRGADSDPRAPHVSPDRILERLDELLD